MRTTVDLPDDLHQRARAIARDQGLTFSQAIALLIRRGLGQEPVRRVGTMPDPGLPVVSVGRLVTSEDVRSLDDEP